VSELADNEGREAVVDILGVRRRVSVELLVDDPPRAGEWVLVHVGFALSKISASEADEQLRVLAMLGESETAKEELEKSM
jgi:hydrogenase expression/formation protein HypC